MYRRKHLKDLKRENESNTFWPHMNFAQKSDENEKRCVE